MDAWGFAIATGVLSGFVSAVVIFVVRTLILGHLMPWYHEQVYRGIRVDGLWHASAHDMAQDIELDISQHAGALKGTAKLIRRSDKHEKFDAVREFTVEGRMQDRYVAMLLTHKNRQRIGLVSFLLEPVADGQQLKGQMSFVSVRRQHLDATEIKLFRDASLAHAERLRLEQLLRDIPARNVRDEKTRRANAKEKPIEIE